MSKALRAHLIKELLDIRTRADAALDLLLPDDGEDGDGCAHPADQVVDISTMGETMYRCTACQQEQPEPFHSHGG